MENRQRYDQLYGKGLQYLEKIAEILSASKEGIALADIKAFEKWLSYLLIVYDEMAYEEEEAGIESDKLAYMKCIIDDIHIDMSREVLTNYILTWKLKPYG